MASAYSQVEKNQVKTVILMLIFTAFVMLVGYLTSLYVGSYFPVYFAGFAALFGNATSFWFSDKIALASSGARLADESQYRDLHRIVENLSITAGLPKPKIYIIDDPAPNAFATGRDPKHSSVAVTTGLLELLDKTELEGVLAHELSHIKDRDILVMSAAVVLAGLVGMLADMAWRGGLIGGSNRENKGPLFVWFFMIAMIVAPIAAKLIQLAISRKREFLADSSGALLTRYPEGLASALIKISKAKIPMRHASTATAHLFIANPFAGADKGFGAWLAKLFSTHPPIEERVKALMAMDRG